MSKNYTPDQTRDAAHFLREQALARGIEIRSSHAHALVAAYLGYHSRKALLDNQNFLRVHPSLPDRGPHIDVMVAALGRMNPPPVDASPESLDFLVETIRSGLNGGVHEQLHGICRICGPGIVYVIDDLYDLDEHGEGLCDDHFYELRHDDDDDDDDDDLVIGGGGNGGRDGDGGGSDADDDDDGGDSDPFDEQELEDWIDRAEYWADHAED